MNKRVVLFSDGSPLYLERVVYYSDGSGNIKSGWVKNGGWNLFVNDGEFQAKDGRFIVSRWRPKEVQIVPVPTTVKGHYNNVIAWAEKQL